MRRVDPTIDTLSDMHVTTRAIYHTIAMKQEISGYTPSMRELCELSGVKSTSTVAYHLGLLEAAGLIVRRPGANRLIQIVKPGSKKAKRGCPTCGAVVVDVRLVDMARAPSLSWLRDPDFLEVYP